MPRSSLPPCVLLTSSTLSAVCSTRGLGQWTGQSSDRREHRWLRQSKKQRPQGARGQRVRRVQGLSPWFRV